MKNILYFLTLFIFINCSTDNETVNDQLPAITTTGARTAGCIVNGKVVIPKDGVNSLSGHEVQGLKTLVGINFFEPVLGGDYYSFSIANLKDKGHSYTVYVHLNNLHNGIGEYEVGPSIGDYFVHNSSAPYIIVRETQNGVSGKRFTSGENSGTITVSRFDSILSGTFSGTVYNKDDVSEKIEITDGRFDFKISQ